MPQATQELDPRTRTAVVGLLYQLADDSLIIGHRMSEWTGLGPILEEDIAFSSMAQDKMGHALAYYSLLHDLGEPDPDRLAYERQADSFRCCSLVAIDSCPPGSVPPAESLCNNPTRDRLLTFGDWAIELVRQFLYSEADAVRNAALEQSSYAPLARLARKFRGELKYHTLHGRTIIQRLGTVEESRERLQGAIETLWPHALAMFEPKPCDPAPADAGVCPPPAELCERWRADVQPLLDGAGLRAPADTKPAADQQAVRDAALARAVEDLQKVARLAPGAQW